MKGKRVFIIGAGFSKATSNKAPLGRELLKYMEDIYDNFRFINKYLYSPPLKNYLDLGRKASEHFREIVNDFHNNFYSTVFPKSNSHKKLDFNFNSQYDLELLLSLLVINNEIFHRSNISYGDILEKHFYMFTNWSIMQTLSPSLIKDDLLLAKQFCEQILTKDDTIISFNYDLLLDIALYNSDLWYPITKKKDGYYCSYWDKGIPIIYPDIFPFKLSSEKNINYIKIHGSVNWFYPDNIYDAGIEQEYSRDLAKLFMIDNGKCIFDKDLEINFYKYLIDRGYFKFIDELCILKPTLGKQYLKYPFAKLASASLKHISEATDLIIIGYSFPLYDTLSEILLLNINPDCKITIVNYGIETEKLERRIAIGTEFEKISSFDKGLKDWMNNN